MTAKEAIKTLSHHFGFLQNTWKPHPDYKVLDAINVAISALNKQTPRKVVFVHPLQYDDNGDYMCPTCNYGTVYNAYGHQSLFCPYCGQKLDWTEVK